MDEENNKKKIDSESNSSYSYWNCFKEYFNATSVNNLSSSSNNNETSPCHGTESNARKFLRFFLKSFEKSDSDAGNNTEIDDRKK